MNIEDQNFDEYFPKETQVKKERAIDKMRWQFCSRELAEKLKSLGINNSVHIKEMFDGEEFDVPNVGTFYSCILHDDVEMFGVIGDQEDAPYKMYKPIKLYSVAELGMMLRGYNRGIYESANDKWVANIEHRTIDSRERNYGTGTTHYQTMHNTEAEARADMLIYLIENKIITAEQINNKSK